MPDKLKGRILIVNKSKGTTVGKVDMADTFFSRFRGLMLKNNINGGLILEIPEGRGRHGAGIHMFFMRIPLDVIFLDEGKIVVDLVSLKPWQTYTPKKAARYVLELQEGSFKSSGIEIGDELDFTCDMA